MHSQWKDINRLILIPPYLYMHMLNGMFLHNNGSHSYSSGCECFEVYKAVYGIIVELHFETSIGVFNKEVSLIRGVLCRELNLYTVQLSL